MRPDLPLIQAEEVEQTVITDTTTGDTRVVGGRVTTISADPMTGARRRVTTNTIIRGDDGRVADPKENFECACGKSLLAKQSVVFCTRCQHPVCHDCVRGGLCQSCRQRTIVRRFFRWLLNVH